MKLKKFLLLMMVTALLIAPAGCIFSPDEKEDDKPIDTKLPPAVTPMQLMLNFEVIYTEMLIDEFTDMLHKDYKTILLSETQADWGWPSDFYFDYTDEVTIHTKMFRGDPGEEPDGNPIHPIDSIVVALLEPQGDWNPIDPADTDFGADYGDFEGGKWANYRVNIQFFNADLSHKFEVQQQVNFYVAPEEQEDGRTIYLMLGQRGLALDQ